MLSGETAEFIGRWKGASASERANAQSFLSELCDLILLDGAPAYLDSGNISAEPPANIASVKAVDHVHAWSITEERNMITLEATVATNADMEAARQALKQPPAEVFGVEHATVEFRAETG